MSNEVKSGGSTVIPCLRYRDATKAIEWLCSVFGFEKQLVVLNENGTIAHAQKPSLNLRRLDLLPVFP